MSVWTIRTATPQRLRNTYRNFARVNPVVTGWRRLFHSYLAPRLTTTASLLDVGCGGGDLANRLSEWAVQAGRTLSVTAIDKDPRAIAFALSRPLQPRVRFRHTTAEELLASGERFDIVVSNHLLHHLSDQEVTPFLATTAALAERAVVHNDLRRHTMAFAAFALTRPLFPNSFTTEDGLMSIRRAFTAEELRRLAPNGWEVRTAAPFRNLVVLEK